MKVILSSPKDLKTIESLCASKWLAGESVELELITPEVKRKKRTTKQNSAMHKYFDQLAKALCDGGYTLAMILTKPLDIPPTGDTIKEFVWRRVQKAMFDVESTADLEPGQVGEVYRVVDNCIMKLTDGNVTIPFPEEDQGRWGER